MDRAIGSDLDMSFLDGPFIYEQAFRGKRRAAFAQAGSRASEGQIRKHAIRKSAVSRREEKTLVFVEEEDIALWPILMNFVRKSCLDEILSKQWYLT